MDPGEYFKQLPLFADLSAEDIVDVLRMAKVVRFAPGEHLCRRGEKADCLYVIEHGRASVRIHEPDAGGGPPIEVAVIGSGEMIGELALVDGQPRSADVVAIEEVRGYRLDRADFDRMREQLHPAVFKMLRRIAITVSDRLRDINDHISREIVQAGGRSPTRPGSTPIQTRASDPGRVSRAQERITKQSLTGVRVPPKAKAAMAAQAAGSEASAPPRKKKATAAAAAGKKKGAKKKRKKRPPTAGGADAPAPPARRVEAPAAAEKGGGFWSAIKDRIKGGAAS